MADRKTGTERPADEVRTWVKDAVSDLTRAPEAAPGAEDSYVFETGSGDTDNDHPPLRSEADGEPGDQSEGDHDNSGDQRLGDEQGDQSGGDYDIDLDDEPEEEPDLPRFDASEATLTDDGIAVDPRAGVDGIPRGVDDPIADPAGRSPVGEAASEAVFDRGQGAVERPGADELGGASLGYGSGAGMAGVGTPAHDVDGLRAEHGGATRHDLGSDSGVDVPTGVMDEDGIGPDTAIETSGTSVGMDDDGGVLGDGGFGAGRPTAPSMDDVVDTGPDKPGIDETRTATPGKKTTIDFGGGDKTTTIVLEDGSEATLAETGIEGGTGFFVDMPDGTKLEGAEASDHIGEHLPLEPIPPGDDQLEPGLDPEASEQLMAEIEENTHYSEATWAAWKGSEVNPDPGSEGGGDAGTVDMAPFEPDYGDPFEAEVGSAVPITAEDVDPGTIDPVE
jgi:hypothetical protein